LVLREFLDRNGVEETCELRSRFGLMALHGGNLERATDVIADEVARRTGSSYYGVVQQAPLRHHVPSVAFDPAHSPALASFIDHVEVVVAIHGYGREGYFEHLLVGGTNRPLANHLAGHLRMGLPAIYTVIDSLTDIPEGLRGLHRHNPVNRPRGGGVQIELPPTIRWNRAERNWSDHESTPRSDDVDCLITVLTHAIVGWKFEAPLVPAEFSPE
jgi:phage replication-related protein YjqB (UPF0714/DUF867 family)